MATFDREKFRQLRRQRKITIDDAALKAEVHRVTLSCWERGVRVPSGKNIRALAHALGVSVSNFSDLQEEEVSDANLSDLVKSWLAFADANDSKRDEQQNYFINYIKKQYTEFKQASLVIKAILSAMQSVFYVKDTELKYITANDAFRKIFALNPGYIVLGKIDEDFFTPKEAKENTELDRKVIYSGEPIVKLQGYMPGTRKKKMGMISKLPIFDADGKIAGLVSFVVDMTNEFRNEEDRKLLEATLAGSSDVVWLVSFSPKKKIIFVSDSVEKVYGYPKEKFEKDYDFWWNSCVYQDDKESLIDYKYPNDMKSWATRLSESGVSSELTRYRIIDSSGNVKWIEESMFIKKYLDIDCMCFIERDITERYQTGIMHKQMTELVDMLKGLTAESSEIIWIKTFNQGYLFLEGAVEKILSVPKKKLLNTPDLLMKRIHPDDLENVKNIYSNNTFPITLEYRVKNNTSVYTSISETVFKNDKYYFGIIKNDK